MHDGYRHTPAPAPAASHAPTGDARAGTRRHDETRTPPAAGMKTSGEAGRSRGGDLRLAALNPDVRKVLDLSGFTKILRVLDTVEDAVTSFGGGK